ncbi:hypothetical protein FJY68_00185 [candidate division WOR-3 bacterium]|uniref:Uncharacterized protein n=1 Tax=candidate division WOR-3 bacterium TaxID=2052148 RepID=A0A938BNK6_UNCW3|nr:hypothetical protein [candidate division WOR-3 bacterium]
MNQIELNQRARDLLDRVRHKRKVLSLFDMPSDLAEAAVWEIGRTILDHQGLRLVEQNAYRWYLRELSRLLRTRTGWDLALELEICLRKWAGYKLDSELLQALLSECYEHIAVMTPEAIEESPHCQTGAAAKSEARMTIEARNPNVPPRKHEGHETRSPNAPNSGRSARDEVAAVGGGDE